MPTGQRLHSGSSQIVRADLIELLDGCAAYPLTLITAPAGSGKSTLLDQWRNQKERTEVVLYTAHERDQDPLRFFRRLTHAIRDAVGNFDSSWYNPLADSEQNPPDIVAEQLADALSRIPSPLHLVIDDFQALTSPFIVELFDVLSHSLPDNIRLIIASRGTPAIATARLRLEDKVRSIDQDDLRWKEAHVHALSSCTSDEPLSEEYTTQLLKLTEGWIAGVRLMLMAQARGQMTSIMSFDGSQAAMVEYFSQVVFKGLPESTREFLLYSAVFENINAGLCDHVMERQDSALLIEKIHATGLFLTPSKHEQGWYRYHPLLRDYTSSRLQIEKQPMIAALHSRATSYFLDKSQYESALFHARESADQRRFMQVLEEACLAWIKTGHMTDILKWVAPLPDALIISRKRLIIPLIAALTLSRRFNQAHYFLDMLVQSNADHDATRGLTETDLRYLDISLNSFEKHVVFEVNERWDLLLQHDTRWEYRAPSLSLLAYHHLMEARLEQSIRFATESKALLSQLGYVYMESFSDLVIALCYRNAGQATMASRIVSNLYDQTAKHSPAWSNRATAKVVVLYERNQLEKARQLCEELISAITHSSATEAIATVYLTLARILYQQASPQRAQRILEQLHSILQLGNYQRFLSQAVQESLRQAYLSGKQDLCEHLATRHHLRTALAAGEWDSARPYDESWERHGLATVYWLLSRYQVAQAQRILRVLEVSSGKSEMRARHLVIEAMIITVEKTTPEKSAQAVKALIDTYGVENMTRFVFDEAPGFGDVLMATHAGHGLRLPDKYIENYPEIFNTQGILTAADTVTPVTPSNIVNKLTDREMDIFQLITSGHSNKDISEKTGTAISTIKWHLKNIYDKLGITSRTEAILLSRHRSHGDVI